MKRSEAFRVGVERAIGAALAEIRNYRLINVSIVAKVLSCEDTVQPTHESQVRPMIGLESDQLPKVWKLAIKIADGGAITEQIVKEAVREV